MENERIMKRFQRAVAELRKDMADTGKMGELLKSLGSEVSKMESFLKMKK